MEAGQVVEEDADETLADTGGVPGRVRGDDDVGHLPERGFGRERLGIGDVDPGTGNGARLEGEDQGFLIDRAAPAGIEEKGGVAHGGEFGGAEHMAGVRSEREGVDDEVGPGQQLGKLGGEEDFVNVGGLGGGAVTDGEDVQSEGASLNGDGVAEIAEADDAESLAFEFKGTAGDGVVVPVGVELGAVGGGEVTGEGEQHGEDVLGDLGGVGAAGVGDDDIAVDKGGAD